MTASSSVIAQLVADPSGTCQRWATVERSWRQRFYHLPWSADRRGIVHLWGLVGSEAERKALTALAEGLRGVVRVSDQMIPA